MATKVIYSCEHSCEFSREFAVAMFKKYPPHTSEGRALWSPVTPNYWCATMVDELVDGYVYNKYDSLSLVKQKDTGFVYDLMSYKTFEQWRALPCITAEFGCAKCLSYANDNGDLRMVVVPDGITYKLEEYDEGFELKLSIDASTVVKDLLTMARSGVSPSVAPVTSMVLKYDSLDAAEAELLKTCDKLTDEFNSAVCPGTCFQATRRQRVY